MNNQLHAHYLSHETDCDGPHSTTKVLVLNEAEQALNDSGGIRTGDHVFKTRMLRHAVDLYPGGTLQIQSEDGEPTLLFSRVTEEGHKNVEVRLCRDECQTEGATR